MPEQYTTGVRELDELLGGLQPHTMLLIAGHPGAGKTTLAAHICYSNSLNGGKCLYITFYEDKEKLYRNMSAIGLDLRSIEEKGFLHFIKLPVASTDEILNAIMSLITRDQYDVVVLDSLNPVLEMTQQQEASRAILLNFFYQLTSLIKGVLVTVAEIPLGKSDLDLGAVEFVVDAIIYLKHRVEHGLLSRIMEVRKVRGAPLTVVEAPFLIIEGEGVKVYVPPKPARVLSGKERGLKTTIELITEMLGELRKGDILHVSYPPHGRSPLVIAPLIDLAVSNDARVLFVSFTYAPDELRELFISICKNYFELEPETTIRVLNRYFYLVSYNPAAYSLTHLNSLLVELIKDLNPDIVVLHGGEELSTFARDPGEFWALFKNFLIWLKNSGILVIVYSARVRSLCTKMTDSLSDAVARLHYRYVNGEPKFVFHIWMRGSNPRVFELTEKDFDKYSHQARKLSDLVRLKTTSG